MKQQNGIKKVARSVGWAGVMGAALVFALPVRAEAPPTLAQLQARAQIQDLLMDYYSGFGADESHFGDYYLADGVLDVNGDIAQGQQAIGELYRRLASDSPPRKGLFRMLLTNLRIKVHGDSATADMMWTGVLNTDLHAPPQFAEQGREHDELVRRGGHWLFKHRVITADSGMPAMFDRTYKKR